MQTHSTHPGQTMGGPKHDDHQDHGRAHYGPLALMTVLMFFAMYGLMYAMVDSLPNVFNNVNQVYMAGLMTAPMVVIELLIMRTMYRDRRLNVAVLGASVVVGLACWFAIREQAAVSDRQFVRSMIPHHAGAILMCEKNVLEDPRLRDLCGEIVAGQREEIAGMKAILDDLNR